MTSATAHALLAASPRVAQALVMVFIGTGNDLRVYEEVMGTQLASWTTSGPIFGSPAIANGRIYFGSTDHTFYVLKAGPR